MQAFDALDVEGPVTAEVFVVTRCDDRIFLTGPDGPQAWLIQAVDSGHPMRLVEEFVRRHLPATTLVHSTSWRYDDGRIVLSFVVVIPVDAAAGLARIPIERADLARGNAHEAPADVAWQAVLEHGLRHLAWLAEDDDAVSAALDPEWHAILGRYVPAPFQHLGGSG